MAGVIRFDRARLLALVRAGAHDQAVAEAVGCSLTWAQKVRQAAGLKANRPPLTAERRGRLRELFEQVRAKHGVPHLRALDTGTAHRKNAEFAAGYGLPPMPRCQVLVLVQLAGGPKTAEQLADGLRKPFRGKRSAYHAFASPKVPGGHHLEALRRRGLLAAIEGERAGRGRAPNLYFATAAALRLMRRATATTRGA